MKKEKEIKNLDNQEEKGNSSNNRSFAEVLKTTLMNELEISKDDEFVCVEEALKLLGIGREKFDLKIKPRFTSEDIKMEKSNTGGKKLLYRKSILSRLLGEEEEEQKVVKIQSKATKLAEKNDELTVAEAFKQKIRGAGADTIFQSAMALMEVALNELRKENNTLKIQLDQTNEYYTMKRVLIINEKEEKWENEKGKKHFTYNPFLLAKTSRKMNKDIKLCPDVNFDTINSYHIDVWKECYPNEKY